MADTFDPPSACSAWHSEVHDQRDVAAAASRLISWNVDMSIDAWDQKMESKLFVVVVTVGEAVVVAAAAAVPVAPEIFAAGRRN